MQLEPSRRFVNPYFLESLVSACNDPPAKYAEIQHCDKIPQLQKNQLGYNLILQWLFIDMDGCGSENSSLEEGATGIARTRRCRYAASPAHCSLAGGSVLVNICKLADLKLSKPKRHTSQSTLRRFLLISPDFGCACAVQVILRRTFQTSVPRIMHAMRYERRR